MVFLRLNLIGYKCIVYKSETSKRTSTPTFTLIGGFKLPTYTTRVTILQSAEIKTCRFKIAVGRCLCLSDNVCVFYMRTVNPIYLCDCYFVISFVAVIGIIICNWYFKTLNTNSAQFAWFKDCLVLTRISVINNLNRIIILIIYYPEYFSWLLI